MRLIIILFLVLTPSKVYANPPNIDRNGDNLINIFDINDYITTSASSYNYRDYLLLMYQFSYRTDGEYFTIQVEEESYCLYSTNPTTIAAAQGLLSGQGTATIPVGPVVRNSGGLNYGYGGPSGDVRSRLWNWHMHPLHTSFAELTKEVCDGLPHYVELGTITSSLYCPWHASVIANSCPSSF